MQPLAFAEISNATIKEALKKSDSRSFQIAGNTIKARVALRDFYADREFSPAWPDKTDLDALIGAIEQASQHGLNPDDYHRNALQNAMTASNELLTELLATDAFLTLGAHLLGGRLNPLTFEPDWTAAKRERNLAQVLEKALENHNIGVSLGELEPDAPGYQTLKAALVQYRNIRAAGGWEPISSGKSLKLGESGPRVVALRQRLMASGLLDETAVESPEIFDIKLESAVAAFQHRIGIEADGVVGPVTLRNLNITPQQRIDQILANMERWRWLPENLGARHIRVNIADYRLEARYLGNIERTHDVIVGRTYRMTPVFSDNISYVVFNPWWETPPNLARQDKLPAFKSNPESVRKLGFEVLDSSGRQVNPDNLRWSDYSASNFPYRLRQRPGPLNALGQVKIMFPNKHNVYLHDTPTRDLFSKSERALSSGCVRVSSAVDLAEWVLRDTPSWTRERIDNAITSGKETRADLKLKLPVHILYFTVVTDADTSLRFVNDIYGRDERLIKALSFNFH